MVVVPKYSIAPADVTTDTETVAAHKTAISFLSFLFSSIYRPFTNWKMYVVRILFNSNSISHRSWLVVKCLWIYYNFFVNFDIIIVYLK